MPIAILSISITLILLPVIAYKLLSPKDTATSINIHVYGSSALTIVFVLLYAYSSSNLTGPVRAFLDLRYGEFNHSATFSTLLLFAGGMASLGISLFATNQKRWFRAYFVLVCAALIFLALDEYYLIHETIPQWERYYIPPATLLGLLGIVVFWRSRPPYALLIFVALFGGLTLSAIGGIVFEEFRGDACFGWLGGEYCQNLPVLEEVLEFVGYIFASAALLMLGQQVLREGYPRFLRFVSLTALSYLLFIVFNVWLQPAIENRFFAESSEIHFAESNLVVTGHRLNQTAFRAGDTLRLDLFWQNSESVSQEFGYTVNILDPVTGASILREDLTIKYPPVPAWFQGVTYRTRFSIVIPETIETPVSPILTLSVWRKRGESYQIITADESSVPFFAETNPVLETLSFLSPSSNAQDISYRFANGITLAEPSLAALDESHYSLQLAWSTEADISQSLAYFIHFLHENGQDHLIFDRPPFDNRFLTIAWVKGMNEQEEILLELPEDAVGRYEVYMGLLQNDNGERVPVQDKDGNALLNHMIPLGRVELAAD